MECFRELENKIKKIEALEETWELMPFKYVI